MKTVSAADACFCADENIRTFESAPGSWIGEDITEIAFTSANGERLFAIADYPGVDQIILLYIARSSLIDLIPEGDCLPEETAYQKFCDSSVIEKYDTDQSHFLQALEETTGRLITESPYLKELCCALAVRQPDC